MLVGREREVQFLAQCLDAAIDSRPRLVLCRGGTGRGKDASGRGVVGVGSSAA